MARTAKPEKLKSGKWRVRWHDHAGTRRSKVFDTHEEAARVLRAKQTEADEIRRGMARPVEHRTFADLIDRWLSGRGAAKRSAKDDASIIRRHLGPEFRNLPLGVIRESRIDAYRDAKLAELSPKTVRNHLTLLGTMMGEAKRLGWLPGVPDIQKPRLTAESEYVPNWLETRQDIDRFLTAARSLAEPGDPWSELPYVVYSTATFSGLRLGEIAGLTWAEVSLSERTIHVTRSFDGRTKTRASRRFVPIVDALLPTLRSWRIRCPPSERNLVFPNRAGNMHGGSARLFQETLHRVLDHAGFERPSEGRHVHCIHFHSLRHTFACHWRLNGGEVEGLIRVLGHTSRRMTEHYANVGGYHRPEHFSLFSPLPPSAAPDLAERVEETG